jgi:hypothetical protein
LATSVVKYQPWRISVAGFWLSSMANFMKEGAPHVNQYGGIMAFAIDNTGYKKNSDFQ